MLRENNKSEEYNQTKTYQVLNGKVLVVVDTTQVLCELLQRHALPDTSVVLISVQHDNGISENECSILGSNVGGLCGKVGRSKQLHDALNLL